MKTKQKKIKRSSLNEAKKIHVKFKKLSGNLKEIIKWKEKLQNIS